MTWIRHSRALVRRVLAVMAVVGSAAAAAPQPVHHPPTGVPRVQTVGCVAVSPARGTAPGRWWLLDATEPAETAVPFATQPELDAARRAPRGGTRLQLIGVADFLDRDGLLGQHRRADVTAPASANASGQLAPRRRVAVKGLLDPDADPPRLNLTSVIDLDTPCVARPPVR